MRRESIRLTQVLKGREALSLATDEGAQGLLLLVVRAVDGDPGRGALGDLDARVIAHQRRRAARGSRRPAARASGDGLRRPANSRFALRCSRPATAAATSVGGGAADLADLVVRALPGWSPGRARRGPRSGPAVVAAILAAARAVRRGRSSRAGRGSRGRSSRGRSGAGGGGTAAAASFLGAVPPSAERGAAMMRAGSAPMPSTPRLPCVRISKSRSSRPPTPKASRAVRMASSTVLPVNSWYSLIDVSLAGCCVAWPA